MFYLHRRFGHLMAYFKIFLHYLVSLLNKMKFSSMRRYSDHSQRLLQTYAFAPIKKACLASNLTTRRVGKLNQT
jgi:hypothetical protein